MLSLIKVGFYLFLCTSNLYMGLQGPSNKQDSKLTRTDYALIFATNNYEEWDDLVNPLNDASAIASELSTTYGYKTEVIENYSKEQVMGKIHEYSIKAYNVNDQLLIFFAGHGFYDEALNTGYLVCKDSKPKDISTTIPYSELANSIDSIPINHILLTLDICQGMAPHPQPLMDRRNRANQYENLDKTSFIARQLKSKTRKYITAGGNGYSPNDQSNSSSSLSNKFLEGLKSRGGPDRILTLQELQWSLGSMDFSPRAGSFGTDQPGSNFLFVVKDK